MGMVPLMEVTVVRHQTRMVVIILRIRTIRPRRPSV